jgi:fatty-acyl-CoA synthase
MERAVVHVSYASGASDVPLLGETIGANFQRISDRFPDREALVDCTSKRRFTYRQLNHEVDRVARGLLALGIEKGDRVGIWSPNSVEWVLAQYATAKLGIILVNVNPSYQRRELEYVMRQSGIKVLILAVGHKTSNYKQMIEETRGSCPDLDHVFYIAEKSWDDLIDRGTTIDPQAIQTRMKTLSFDDAINIQYTSGTTGFPKGATLSHHNILNNGFFVGELIDYTENDRVCVPVPFYHCFGMVMGNLGITSHGACIVIPAPSFDAAATLRAVSEEKCTSLYGVPTMFIAELAHADFAKTDFSSLRTGIMAGSPCPVEVMKRVLNEMNMKTVAISYGMTETSPVSTMTRPDDDIDHRCGTVGRAMPHIEIKVVDPETGLEVPRGTIGELCTRGYSVMLGYWQEPEKTAQAIDAAGWMHTGDLAMMADDGYVNISGRIKDLVIRGGENVYPREVEEFLYTHPDITDVSVIGVPDEKYGEELMAWVVMREGASPLTVEALRAFCTGQLAHYKIPRYLHLVTAFPMTVTGKVRKVEMREMAVDILGLGDVAKTKTA